MNPEAEAQVNEAIKEQRPLSAAAGRNLLKLVENDFKTLRANLMVFQREEIARRQSEIRGEATPEVIEGLQTEVEAIRTEFEKKVSALKAKARELGVEIQNFTCSHPNVGQHNLQVKLNRVSQEVHNEVGQALEIAEAEFRKAERMVLLATVTADAERILTAIPNAQQLMAAAYEERERRRTAALPSV